MKCYLLYDHFDHLLDELAHAKKTPGQVQAYVKLHDWQTRKGDQMMISTAILVTWIHLTERIIHAANIPWSAYNSPQTRRFTSVRLPRRGSGAGSRGSS